jgi:recombination protein RecT
MSNLQRADNLVQVVKLVQPQFSELARIHKAVHWERELSFAIQALNNNAYLSQIAMADQDSLKQAVVNVAASGLSLDPIRKLAYLVPRDKKVMLDISWQGYVHLAVEIGAIKWAKAEVVREKDKFKFKGPGALPSHEFDPFSEKRGNIIGAYCVAKTHDGEYIVDMMKVADIFAIRDRSPSWRSFKENGKKSPWNTDEEEMIKKTVIRRGWKSWPKSDSRRLDGAREVLEADDVIDVGSQPVVVATETEQQLRDAAILSLREGLIFMGRAEEKYIEHLTRVCKREIKKIEDLTEIELGQAKTQVDQWVEKEKARREEMPDENPS